MSQRRGGPKGSNKPVAIEVSNEEMIPFSESLDMTTSSSLQMMDRESLKMEPASSSNAATGTVPAPASGSTTATVPAGNSTAVATTLDARFDTEQQRLRLQAWKEGPFATGLVPATWEEEYSSYRHNMKGQCMKMVDNDNTTPCGCCSAMVCSMMGAGRVGNIAVLRQSTEWVDEAVEDESGETTTKRYTRPRLDFVVGPYWPMLMFVTYPLILGKTRKQIGALRLQDVLLSFSEIHIVAFSVFRCVWLDTDHCHSQQTSSVGSGVGHLDDRFDSCFGIDSVSRSWHPSAVS